MKIGFIGQGFIGRNYADNFEKRGFDIVRYAKEKPYDGNLDKLKKCKIIFIAVPTPTNPKGYDYSIVKEVLSLVPPKSIAVIKSTIQPKITRQLQKAFPDIIVIHSPEFLSESTAAKDASDPFMNIVGIDMESDTHKKAAKLVHSVLPKSNNNQTVAYEEAELIKYAHNCGGYTQIIFFNIMYDAAKTIGANWSNIEQALKSDPYIPNRYASPIHKTGRGAGGNCFIKDFEAFKDFYKLNANDSFGNKVLEAMKDKNIQLLLNSNKDLGLLEGVYGKKVLNKKTKK
jgi:nucleotide sugar dehydrogenase